jgi:hypothetical protein
MFLHVNKKSISFCVLESKSASTVRDVTYIDYVALYEKNDLRMQNVVVVVIVRKEVFLHKYIYIYVETYVDIFSTVDSCNLKNLTSNISYNEYYTTCFDQRAIFCHGPVSLIQSGGQYQGGLVSKVKRRRFISSHNPFFLSHFFDLLLLVIR